MENTPLKKHVVITTIFKPTAAVRAFSNLKNYQLIVVGDKKTPKNWSCEGADYLSVKRQQTLDSELGQMLPYHHYCRKMLGYLHAIRAGANCIVDTDDDNFPKENWNFPEFENHYDVLRDNMGFVNVYQYYTKAKIWPRGLPIRMINMTFELEKNLKTQNCKVGIWQGLADEDPDVDAIYRLTNNTPCYFDHRGPIVLGKGTICPFNTQNTLIRKELFPLLYLPTDVTFRFTDILRGLVAQPLLWLYGYRLGFTRATVVQKRNPHDPLQDFMSEIPMYQHGEKIIPLVDKVISASENMGNNLYNAYKALLSEKIVGNREMERLVAWLKDLQY